MTDAANMSRPERTASTRWTVAPAPYVTVAELAQGLGLSDTVASILVRRGIVSVEQARNFLEAEERHDPAALPGVDGAIELIAKHLDRGSTIAVHGDYDVDGICSTAILVRVLRDLGADVMPHLPSRGDGYGLSNSTIEQLAATGAKLLVTVDCGIGALEEVDHAKSLGLDVVVTDHHKVDERLPACPVVHPAIGDYPTPQLCATAVAYKLGQALFDVRGRNVGELESELDLVALATITDVMPLSGENRTFVKDGLRALAGGRRPGLAALLRVVGIDPQSVTEHTLGFVIGPRLNAAGRLYRPDAGLELMLTTDFDRAIEIARELDTINRERQDVETRILFEAEKVLNEGGYAEDPALVLAGEGWHSGVAGIVASRFVERHNRPCVVIAIDEAGRGKGSARSIPAYDLHGGLESCSQHLARFGGHRVAAGLEIDASNIDAFREQLCEHAARTLAPEDFVRLERIDAVVPGDAVKMGLVEEIERLRPFGNDNPAVNLLLPATAVSDLRPMGEGRHARFTATSGGVRSTVVAFGSGSTEAGLGIEGGERFDIVARLERNDWQGVIEPRLVMKSVSPVQSEAFQLETCGCGDEVGWLDRMLAVYDEPFHSVPTRTTSHQRSLIERRNEGVFGSLAAVIASGDSVLIVCADAARRTPALEQALGPGRFQNGEGSLLIHDYACLTQAPSVADGYEHLFLLDPPTSQAELNALIASERTTGFLHKAWGDAELAFATGKLESELALRDPMRAIYAGLRESGRGAGDVLARRLMGDGIHSRSHVVAGRSLRCLVELGLAGIERSSATVSCSITEGAAKADLEASETFSAAARVLQEGLRFLNGLTSPRSETRAA